jgi:hypothetical protein
MMTYRDLLQRLQRFSESELDQKARVANDERAWDLHSIYIAEQDFFDFKERDCDEPCLPASELSGDETEVRIGIHKGEVTLLVDY